MKHWRYWYNSNGTECNKEALSDHIIGGWNVDLVTCVDCLETFLKTDRRKSWDNLTKHVEQRLEQIYFTKDFKEMLK